MEKFDRSCITNLGRNAIAKLNAGESSIVLTRVQMGRGTVEPSTDIQMFTALADGVQYNDINSANTLVPYQTTIAFTVKGADVIKTFKWSELGIYAKLDDGEEFLFAYAYSSNPDILVGGSKVVDQYVFGIRFENSEKVTVELNVNQTVPLHAATHLGDGVDPIPTVTSARTGLVPVGLNDPKLVLIASDPPHWRPVPLADRNNIGGIPPLDGQEKSYLAGNGRWYRTTPFLVRDTILYVDPAYSDIWPRFSTLAKALEYLSNENISAGVTVTVELSDGTHRIEDTIKFDHPQAQQVRIIGASPRQEVSFTELKESGNDLILKASSVKGLSVGMSVIIDDNDPRLPAVFKGGHTIRNISTPYVTVSRSLIGSTGGNEWRGLTNCYMYFYKPKLDCSKSGLYFPNGLGPSSRFTVHGERGPIDNDGYNGITLSGRASFSSVIVSGFTAGILVSRGYANLDFVAAHDCHNGVTGSVSSSGNLYCNGNSGSGLWVYQANAYLGISTSDSNVPYTFLQGNGTGLLSDSGSHVYINNVHSQVNGIGLIAEFSGSITFGVRNRPNYINGNTQTDILALNGGYVRGFLRGGESYNYSPNNGQVGNANAYILIDS